MQEGSCRADWFPEGKIDSVNATVSVKSGELHIALPDGSTQVLQLSKTSVSGYIKGVPLKVVSAGAGMLSIPDGPVAEQVAKRGMPIGAHVENRLVFWLPALVIGGIAVLALLAFVVVPATAQRIAPRLPVEWVIGIGDFADTQIESWVEIGPVGKDEIEAAATVERIGKELAAPLESHGYNFKFTLDRTEGRVNAFALPNGSIFFTYDLYAKLDEDQVAGVLAHEIAHVTERHGVEALLASSTWFILAAFLFPDPTLLGYVPALAELSYSREAEHEADCEAAAILTQAGYPPYAAADALARLEEIVAGTGGEDGEEGEAGGAADHDEEDWDPGTWDFLSTHPNFPDRTAHARQCAGLEA